MADINREHKDRLFRFIFGNAEQKAWTLSLYNAMNGSSYDDPEAIQLTTIEDVLYMRMKNDVSFLIANTMNIYEHQSSFNPNMPLRCLIYAGMAYSKYVETNDINLYSSKQQKLPVPKLVCFYNGTEEQADRRILDLADAFDAPEESDVSVRVTMLNINKDRNMELMDACKPLQEYAQLIEGIRCYQSQGYDIETAVGIAIDDMSEESVLKPYLLANKAEVKRMCLTEYDEAKTMAQFRAEGVEEGIELGVEKGIEKGIFETLISLVKDGILSAKDAAERAGVTEAAFLQRMSLQ